MRTLLTILLLALLSACDRSAPTAPKPLLIAAASSLKPALEELAPVFETANAGAKVEFTFGSSGSLAARITQGAPFDLFLAADTDNPDRVLAAGKGTADTRRVFATGTLMLWIRNDSPLVELTDATAILRDPRLKRLAIANPKLAPYGRAAEAALAKLGLADAYKDRLAMGENIEHAAQFALAGAADAALIAQSLALSSKLAAAGRSWTMPADAVPLIEHAGIVLVGERSDLARRFFDFLNSPPGRETLSRHGLNPPKAP